MAHLFRHKTTRLFYLIEHLLLDIHHLNRNGFRGIYAYPCDAAGNRIGHRATIIHNYEGCAVRGTAYDPAGFVDGNFDMVAELYHFD
jgi:YD repeat-containing protein